MNEAAKTLLTLTEEEKKQIFSGTGIDIGCGTNICMPQFQAFDREHGDANHILRYIKDRKYHCVASFHSLEHMINPYRTIQDWWELVQLGGYLVVAVPDEDLYEQGIFPSRFNRDHKWTFTIAKEDSWCDRSINVMDLIKLLDHANLIKCSRQDKNYNYRLKNVDQTRGSAMAQILLVLRRVAYTDTDPIILEKDPFV